ncbi:MAG: hypothetical protein ACJA01_001104 [Saprospiraceae bacterium]|jgi:hypothetical protein
MKSTLLILLGFLIMESTFSQNYYYEDFGPFDQSIPTPSSFLGYEIGEYHTRHDRIVAYMEALDGASDRASLIDYGKTHELRRLVILQISTADQIENLETIRKQHLTMVDPASSTNSVALSDIPIFVNLGYNVHGNEPSSSEAAMLAAYVMIASEHPDIQRYREDAVVFVDPTINPDGRDRHTQWANSLRGDPLVADPTDAEHNEMWPRGRTNHYWFDLNRDWLLAVHPESQGKLKWYHQWYPNVVTDFHEMGSNSTYFFEPMKDNGSLDPIMPVANYTTLNDTFATFYQRELDKLGSLYFTKEIFDGTYPGYGSSYPDIQGGLGILFEQASSRGHVQETPMGDITFPFTIRNQFVNSIATVEAAAENKGLLRSYQKDFFSSAISNARNSKVKSYVFQEMYDKNRLKAFLELLLLHKIDVYSLNQTVTSEVEGFNAEHAYVVPTEQAQYRMVQTMFETYSVYRDSVYYDASAWSLANAYNIKYAPSSKELKRGNAITMESLEKEKHSVAETHYAYLMAWDDYNAPAALRQLQNDGIRTLVSRKEFSIQTATGQNNFTYGTIIIPVQKQEKNKQEVNKIINKVANKWNVSIHSISTGFSKSGVDVGSTSALPVTTAKAMMLIGNGVSSYEAGFVWHLLDERVKMPITKVQSHLFDRAKLSKYNTMVLVSGSYSSLDSIDIQKIRNWVSAGNTLITIGGASSWAIHKKLVKEKLVEKPKDNGDKDKEEELVRHPYVKARDIHGKDAVGGSIFKVDLDITHPIAYGYRNRSLPVYRNNSVWLKPSANEFSNVAVYTEDPHIDGFITDKIRDQFLKKSASIIVSKVGSGRVVLFAEDPNFRGTWYGTNKLFLNAVFFGDKIQVP